MHRPDTVHDIEILSFEGFEALDAIGPLEVFRTAARDGLDLRARLVSYEPSRQVTAASGLVVEPDGSLSVAPDLLVVPGGGWSDRAPRGVHEEINHGALPEAIAERHAAGSAIASVCTGALLLGAAGLLDGRPATTHRSARSDLDELAESVLDARVVDDGDVLTAGGVTAGLDLALHIVGECADERLAAEVADTLEYERQGRVVVGSEWRSD